MRWTLPSILSLIPVAALLGGAAAPPADCTPDSLPGQTLPVPLDLSGRPDAGTGLTGQAFVALPSVDGSGCRGASAALRQDSTLQNTGDDVVHSLPLPDILNGAAPRQRPEFR